MTDTLSSVEQPARPDHLRILSLVLIVIGILISGYISYTKITDTAIVCLEGDGQSCDVVQNSIYSRIARIDIAYLGLLTYLFLGALVILENRLALVQEFGRILVFGVTLFAFVYAIWLVYVQAAILAAFCMWCLGHELTMTLLFIISALRLWQQMRS